MIPRTSSRFFQEYFKISCEDDFRNLSEVSLKSSSRNLINSSRFSSKISSINFYKVFSIDSFRIFKESVGLLQTSLTEVLGNSSENSADVHDLHRGFLQEFLMQFSENFSISVILVFFFANSSKILPGISPILGFLYKVLQDFSRDFSQKSSEIF